jgi:hypothetical protein
MFLCKFSIVPDRRWYNAALTWDPDTLDGVNSEDLDTELIWEGGGGEAVGRLDGILFRLMMLVFRVQVNKAGTASVSNMRPNLGEGSAETHRYLEFWTCACG